MDAGRRIETALDAAVAHAEAPGAPPRLAEAIRYAVFPGGHRIRPRLCLSVARACGDDDPAAADAAAAAIELLHCASLVHDDLPCFDDAPMRRQKASVHVAFGEPLAVLTGDDQRVAGEHQCLINISGPPRRAGRGDGGVGVEKKRGGGG
ncbi:polyprenyl synthetase family protein, partial [Methylobacterium sp. WL9]|uniref:polyprenyl synthetase family protein n=1 Tax=Methylobacterium sp. WL9 TaxID=2603898 RepID=UPI001FEE74CD